MKLIHIIITFVLLGYTFNVNADEVIFTQGTFKEILDQAAQVDKLIFLDCYTIWCGPCKMMEKEVFALKKIGDYLNDRFVNFKMDMEKDEGKELAQRYQIKAYPTFLILNSKGEELHRIVGGQKPEQFLNQVEEVFSDKSLYKLTKRYNDGDRSDNLVKNYINALGNAYKAKEMQDIFIEYWSKLSVQERCDPSNWSIVKRCVNKINSEAYQYLIKNKKDFIKTVGSDEINNKLSLSLQALVINGCNDIIYKRTEGNRAALNDLKKSVKRADIEKSDYLVTTIDYTLAYMDQDIPKILKMYKRAFKKNNCDEKLTATLQLNAMLYGSKNPIAKQKALQLIRQHINDCGWVTENSIIQSVIETLEEL